MILKQLELKNGSIGGLHIVQSIHADQPFDQAQLTVNSYVSEAAHQYGAGLIWQERYMVPVAELGGANMLDAAEAWLITNAASPLVGGSVVYDRSESLESMKDRKRAEITRDRLAADADHFIYMGKAIRTANKDMTDLLVTDARMSKGMPANWPGGWKAIDNSYVIISTLEAWDTFFVAMYDAGIGNYNRSQELKALIEEATTIEQLTAISWTMALPGDAPAYVPPVTPVEEEAPAGEGEAAP
jgi:hypothetical protein